MIVGKETLNTGLKEIGFRTGFYISDFIFKSVSIRCYDYADHQISKSKQLPE